MTSALDTARPQSPPTTSLQIALAGNPNTGKSTLFNRLTGARQRVGNYPGVTVEKKVGTTRLGDVEASVIDLPGAYSLAAASPDERIVMDVLSGRLRGIDPPDAVVCVLDAANLPRNLFLVSQIAEFGIPVVIALNMCDAADGLGIEIDVSRLSRRLGVPVVRTIASRGTGVEEVRRAIVQALDQHAVMSTVDWPAAVRDAAEQLRGSVEKATGAPLCEVEARRLLFDVDSAIAERIGWEEPQRTGQLDAAHGRLREAGLDPFQVESRLRYEWIGRQLEEVVAFPHQRRAGRTESIDRLLTHRLWGVVTFVVVMYAVFWSIYTFAGPFMEAIEGLFGWLGDMVGGWLEATPMLQALVVDGIIGGVGSVLVFLPQIVLLFLFIALLEDTGYMARAAFLIDKLFSWCGLNGKSFVPMLSSYACAIPGVMGARTIEDGRARLTTILVAPLMSCSARLPVYVLMIGAFIEPRYGAGWAAFCLFAMHLLGLFVAIPTAWLLNRVLFRRRNIPFLLEMPPYRVPQWRDVLWRVFERGSEFLKRAGTVIFAVCIVIWALCYFPRSQAVEEQLVQEVAEAREITVASARELLDGSAGLQRNLAGRRLEQSWMGRLGKSVQPVFRPAGFDWKITVGVLASFPAREVIIATMGIIYNLGGDVDEGSHDLMGAMSASTWPDGSPIFTIPVAAAIMVFFALCMQCGATMSVIAKESTWKWAIFAFVYMTCFAWVGAVVTYQVGTALA